MKAIKWKDSNHELGRNQPDYPTLPVLKIHGEQGYLISCWQLSLKERIKVLFGVNIFLRVMTFNKGAYPVDLAVGKKTIYIPMKTEKPEKLKIMYRVRIAVLILTAILGGIGIILNSIGIWFYVSILFLLLTLFGTYYYEKNQAKKRDTGI